MKLSRIKEESRRVFCSFAPTFVFQSESGCRDADIGEEVKVELVGGAVEQCRDGGALGRGLSLRNVILNKWPLSLL